MSGSEPRLGNAPPASSAAGPPEREPLGLDAPGGQVEAAAAPHGFRGQPKNQFYFVDSSSSSKEKRAHVMRHHVQEKRKQRKMSHGSLQPDQIRESISWQARKDSGYDTDTQPEAAVLPDPQGPSVDQDSSVWTASLASMRLQRHDLTVSTCGQRFGDLNANDLDVQLQIRFSTVKPYAQPAVPLQLGSPMTMLDASRKDPFGSLPIARNPEDLELVDYWTSKLAYWSGQNPYVKNQIFRTAMEHPVSFQAVILCYCARWKAQLYGVTESPEVTRHVGQARQNIEDAAKGLIQVPPDQLAMALSGMALGEERFGDKIEGQRCLNQAAHIMRPRTGSHPGVEVFLHYVRYIQLPQHITADPTDQRWLIAFLRGAEDLMRRHSSSTYLSQVPQRGDAFQMESPLFSLLSSGPRPSSVPQASRMYVVRDAQTQEISRTAALINITAALWDFKDSVHKTGRFLTYLSAMIAHHQLDREPACETLLWLLLEQGCDPDLRVPERAWSTGELLTTHKQLRPDQQFHFNEILMSFLTMRPPIRGIDIFENELWAASNT
ncbi:hypothetical protein N7532_005273 [Penicillium argentinense]|uniref:Uncharacterized protein n=1 Tax=Penicillium argentinense TaxID=1131581 RepID=A0A9W9FE67_9EURO|nr:uncharacterized protein N7532_005273 [Penicillium argentinense]KAJ5098272.1 hypothetical protein N7532_005273 [Penicillium argentinense]